MSPEEAFEAVIAELDRKIRGRGRGAVKEVTEYLGVHRNYFNDVRSGRSPLYLDKLLRTLDFLGEDYLTFLVRVAGRGGLDLDGEPGEGEWGDRELEEFGGEPPPAAVRRARELGLEKEDEDD